MQTSATKSLPNTSEDFRGETICLFVYSDKTHVDYIYPLLDQLEATLRNEGFNPERLGDEIRSSEDYLETLEQIASNCSFGLIILDGFRPNVTFEFGYLKGKGKPIIILQSKDAFFNVKTLYRTTSESGLTRTQFLRLCNPQLDVSYHLSDFAGKHVSKVDWKAKISEPLHPSNVLLTEIGKKKREIINETIRIKTRNLSKKQETELLKPIIEVISLYHSSRISVPIEHIQKLHSRIKDIAKAKNLKPPIEIYNMIISVYEKKTVEMRSVSDIISCLVSIQGINDDILCSKALKKNEESFANTLVRKGSIFLRLFNYTYERKCCYDAINAYRRAAKIFEAKEMKREYAKAQCRIGTAYSELSEVENPLGNCEKAIQAYNESLKILNHEEFPVEYVETQYNRGVAYFNLAKAEGKIENFNKVVEELEKLLKLGKLRLLLFRSYGNIQNLLGATYFDLAKLEHRKDGYTKAFESYEEALKYAKLQDSPVEYALIQNNLGAGYGELALLENKSDNCNKAVIAFNEALKVFTHERYPIDYADTQRNLCEIYRRLSETEDKVVNCNKAIELCNEALKGKIREISPLTYAKSLKNLGEVYETLAEVENPLVNYGKAVEAHNRALAIRELNLVPKFLASTKNALANTYHNLAKTTSQPTDYRKAAKEYKEALRLYIKLGDEEKIDSIRQSLRELSELRSSQRIV